FALVARGRRGTGGMSPRRLFAVGLLLGSAVASEYPAALIAALLGLYAAMATRPRARIAWMAAGAALPLLALAAYHTAAFGGPLAVPYATSMDPAVRGQRFLGISLPDPFVLARVLFSTERGLLHHTPWLALAFPGALCLAWRRATRMEGLVCLALMAVGLLFNASLTRTPE